MKNNNNKPVSIRIHCPGTLILFNDIITQTKPFRLVAIKTVKGIADYIIKPKHIFSIDRYERTEAVSDFFDKLAPHLTDNSTVTIHELPKQTVYSVNIN